jgi:hypothetical protein
MKSVKQLLEVDLKNNEASYAEYLALVEFAKPYEGKRITRAIANKLPAGYKLTDGHSGLEIIAPSGRKHYFCRSENMGNFTLKDFHDYNSPYSQGAPDRIEKLKLILDNPKTLKRCEDTFEELKHAYDKLKKLSKKVYDGEFSAFPNPAFYDILKEYKISHDVISDLNFDKGEEEFEKGGRVENKNEISYKGKLITRLFPSGYYEFYSDKQERFVKFDDLDDAKAQIDSELKTTFGDSMAKGGEAEGEYGIGDLVFVKGVGSAGLVGLITSDIKEEDEESGYDVYFRGLSGSTFFMPEGDIEDILAGHLYLAQDKGDLMHYPSIAKKLGITINSKYEDEIAQDEMGAGGKVGDLESIYKKYSDKDYWETAHDIKRKKEERDYFAQKGGEKAKATTDAEIEKFYSEKERSDFFGYAEKVKKALDDKDSRWLNSNMRANQKVTLELVEHYTGEKAGKNQKEINAWIEKFISIENKIADGNKMEKGGTALDKDTLDDIAWDSGISHKWIENNKWKNDDFKSKAYKLAELEAQKYSKGGEAESRVGCGGINWIITGNA